MSTIAGRRPGGLAIDRHPFVIIIHVQVRAAAAAASAVAEAAPADSGAGQAADEEAVSAPQV
jgi:hypothetical protein